MHRNNPFHIASSQLTLELGLRLSSSFGCTMIDQGRDVNDESGHAGHQTGQFHRAADARGDGRQGGASAQGIACARAIGADDVDAASADQIGHATSDGR